MPIFRADNHYPVFGISLSKFQRRRLSASRHVLFSLAKPLCKYGGIFGIFAAELTDCCRSYPACGIYMARLGNAIVEAVIRPCLYPPKPP